MPPSKLRYIRWNLQNRVKIWDFFASKSNKVEVLWKHQSQHAIKIQNLAPSRAEAACSACCGPSAGFINTQRCVSLPCQGNIPWQDCSEHRPAPHWPKMELQWNEELRRVVQVFIWIGKRSKRFKGKFEVNRYETNVEEDKKKDVILETEDHKFIPHSQYLHLSACKQ